MLKSSLTREVATTVTVVRSVATTVAVAGHSAQVWTVYLLPAGLATRANVFRLYRWRFMSLLMRIRQQRLMNMNPVAQGPRRLLKALWAYQWGDPC